MDNCDMVRSPKVAQGASYSRLQPDFNLRLVKGTQLTGIHTTKPLEFMEGELGIKITSDRNLRQQIMKVQKSIANTYEDRKKETAMTSSRPHCGKNMSLSAVGIVKLTSKILSRFNAKTIDKIAGGGCSNLSENLWGVNTKFSEGKRRNFDHTDAYVSCNKLTFFSYRRWQYRKYE